MGARRGERGQILIINVFSMVALIGISALAIDASFMYDKRNKLFAAADAAAKSAAAEVRRNAAISSTTLLTFANHEIAALGFDPGGATSVELNHPPLSGPFLGNTSYVEVVVLETTATFFGRVLGFANLTPGARAVAGTSPGANCLIALGSSGTVFDAGNNLTINAPGCGFAIDGGMSVGSYTSLSADSIGVTGSCSGACPSPPVSTGVPPAADPFISLPAPADPSPLAPCVVAPTTPLPNTKYCSWSIPAHTHVTLASGTYYFTGAVTAGNSATVDGTGGVTIYLAPGSPGGSINIDNNGVSVELKAPTTGTYAGIAIYQDRANANAANLAKNNGTFTFEGAVYMPAADVSTWNNGVPTSPCTVFVVKSLTVKNNAVLNLDNSCDSFGGSPVKTVSVAE